MKQIITKPVAGASHMVRVPDRSVRRARERDRAKCPQCRMPKPYHKMDCTDKSREVDDLEVIRRREAEA